MPKRDHVALADDYIHNVLAGEVVVSKWTRLACERQQRDLARQSDSDFPYVFDPLAAADPCLFIEQLRHIKGSCGGELIRLEPWECFLITTLWGWKRKDNPRLRRFRRGVIFAGKSNGKSLLSSGCSAFMLSGDGEPAADCLAVARARAQAAVVFETTREMLKVAPELCELFGIQVMQEEIRCGAGRMRMATSQSKTLAGSIPHFISADELWAFPSMSLWEEIERAVDKRENSMLLSISHADSSLSNVGFAQYQVAQAILAQELTDERTFCCLWTAEGYPWTSREALQAANPNLGVSVYEDTLQEACIRAQKVPALQAAYRAKNLCEWVNADLQWLDPDKLAECRTPNLKMETFRFWAVGEHEAVDAPDMHRSFVIGMDLASRSDIAAIVYLCLGYVNGVKHYYAWGSYHLPEKAVEVGKVPKYKQWAQRGLLNVHPGFTNDYDAIEATILDKYRRNLGYGAIHNEEGYNFTACGFDEWQAEQLAGNLNKAGIKSIPFKKNAKNYSPVMDYFSALVMEGRFHFPAQDELMWWAISNVCCHRDKNENLFPNKPGDESRKIDPCVALLYALKVAMVEDEMFVRLERPSPGIVVMDIREPYVGR